MLGNELLQQFTDMQNTRFHLLAHKDGKTHQESTLALFLDRRTATKSGFAFLEQANTLGHIYMGNFHVQSVGFV